MVKDKGSFLLLEDLNGKSTPYFKSDFEKTMLKLSWKPMLVIISSCTSEQIGEVFKS